MLKKFLKNIFLIIGKKFKEEEVQLALKRFIKLISVRNEQLKAMNNIYWFINKQDCWVIMRKIIVELPTPDKNIAVYALSKWILKSRPFYTKIQAILPVYCYITISNFLKFMFQSSDYHFIYLILITVELKNILDEGIVLAKPFETCDRFIKALNKVLPFFKNALIENDSFKKFLDAVKTKTNDVTLKDAFMVTFEKIDYDLPKSAIEGTTIHANVNIPIWNCTLPLRVLTTKDGSTLKPTKMET